MLGYRNACRRVCYTRLFSNVKNSMCDVCMAQTHGRFWNRIPSQVFKCVEFIYVNGKALFNSVAYVIPKGNKFVSELFVKFIFKGISRRAVDSSKKRCTRKLLGCKSLEGTHASLSRCHPCIWTTAVWRNSRSWLQPRVCCMFYLHIHREQLLFLW